MRHKEEVHLHLAYNCTEMEVVILCGHWRQASVLMLAMIELYKDLKPSAISKRTLVRPDGRRIRFLTQKDLNNLLKDARPVVYSCV